MAMRVLGIVVPGEIAVLVAGAGADRMAPDWIPTWALFVTAAFFAGVAVYVYLSGARSDRKKAAKAASDVRAALREELDSRDVQVRRLKDIAAKLPQKPLSDGHTYATLPDGTNIVSMADGSFRLAVPTDIGVAFGPARAEATFKPSITLDKSGRKPKPPATEGDERPR